MSLFPTGERGQRYEISATGYPFEGKTTVIGWAETMLGATHIAEAVIKAPGCTEIAIRDRWEPKP